MGRKPLLLTSEWVSVSTSAGVTYPQYEHCVAASHAACVDGQVVITKRQMWVTQPDQLVSIVSRMADNRPRAAH